MYTNNSLNFYKSSMYIIYLLKMKLNGWRTKKLLPSKRASGQSEIPAFREPSTLFEISPFQSLDFEYFRNSRSAP